MIVSSNREVHTAHKEPKEKRPGAADYTPNLNTVLKTNPRFAEAREARFRELKR